MGARTEPLPPIPRKGPGAASPRLPRWPTFRDNSRDEMSPAVPRTYDDLLNDLESPMPCPPTNLRLHLDWGVPLRPFPPDWQCRVRGDMTPPIKPSDSAAQARRAATDAQNVAALAKEMSDQRRNDAPQAASTSSEAPNDSSSSEAPIYIAECALVAKFGALQLIAGDAPPPIGPPMVPPPPRHKRSFYKWDEHLKLEAEVDGIARGPWWTPPTLGFRLHPLSRRLGPL